MEQPAQQHFCPNHHTPTREVVDSGGLKLVHHVCDQCIEEFDLFSSFPDPPRCPKHPEQELTDVTTYTLLKSGNTHTHVDVGVCMVCYSNTPHPFYEEEEQRLPEPDFESSW